MEPDNLNLLNSSLQVYKMRMINAQLIAYIKTFDAYGQNRLNPFKFCA